MTLVLKIIQKMFDTIAQEENKTRKQQLEQFAKTRIFVYTVTRIVPSVHGQRRVEDLLETGISRENLENLRTFYRGLTVENFAYSQDLLRDESALVGERIEFAEKCIEAKAKKLI